MIRSIGLSLYLCIAGSVTVGAQEATVQMAQPLKHEKKVFVDNETNTVFWPMALPMWVRLSPSPEPDAPSYLLQKMTRNTTMDTADYKAEGIQLDISGRQYIRWANFVTKDTLMLSFNSDGAPRLQTSFSKIPMRIRTRIAPFLARD
ncbi:MAG: hypothetical protein O3B73_02260 [bacterium]|nr:hypothetical protein [bacterium]